MRWKNVPIPETLVIPLAVGITAGALFPRQVFPSMMVLIALGVLLFLLGLALMISSVRVAGSHDMAQPDRLVTAGPYSFSRNPMYLSWILIFLSAILVSRSLWLLLLFPVAILLTHFVAILPEERALKEEFGSIFEEYCDRVRRYF